MANLSNINNKFLVTTGGNVLIGQTADDGNRLQIDGDAIIKNGTYGKILLRSSSNYLYGDANGVLIAAASDNLRLYTAGTQRLRIDSSGNVLLLSNTASFKLGATSQTYLLQSSSHFFLDNTSGTSYFRNTSATGSGFIFRNSNIGDFEFDNEFAGNIKFNTSNVERMRINSSGNVGIGEGTTNPAARLEVSTEVSNGGGQLIIANRSTDAATTPTKRSEIIYKVTDTVGTVKDAAYVRVTPANQNNTTGSSYAIWTSKGSSNPTESMRIDSSGKVIINDNTIGDKLLLAGDNAGTARGLMFNCSTTTNQGDTWDIDAQSSTGIIKFSTGSSERMRIDSSGDVFIKTGYLSLDSKANNSASVAGEYRLALGHDASTDASWIQSNGVSGTQRKLLLNPLGGNVGIGITDPSAKLEVKESLYVSHPNAEEITFRLNNYGATGTDAGPLLRMFNQLGTTVINIDSRGGSSRDTYFNQGGNFGIGTTSPETDLMIYDTVNEDPAEPGFATTGMFALNRSGQATLSMGVGANNSFWMSNVNRAFTGPNYYNISLNPLGGRVGVGTTTPSSKLSVFGTQAAIDFQRGTGDSKWEFSSDAARFYIAEMSTGTRDYVMTLEETTGNVGIGTTSPNTGKLVVKGVPYVVTNSGQAIGGIDITSNASGANTYSGAISFGSTASGRAAIAGVQESSDADTQGLAFFTHGSGTGAADADERMRITRGGDIQIPTNSAKIQLRSSGSAAYTNIFRNANNDLIISNTAGTTIMDFANGGNMTIAGSLTQNSDITLKENIKPLQSQLDVVNKLNPVSYNRIGKKENEIGFIAQEVEKLIPDLVSENSDGLKSLAYANMTSILVKAIQELKAEIELLKSK